MTGSRALFPLVSLALALFSTPAMALSDTDGSGGGSTPPSNVLLQLICSGETCGALDLPDGGMDFDYVFGGRPTMGGLTIDIRTTGSLYVLGPLSADEIHLNAPDVSLMAPDIDFEPLPDLPPISGPICGCIEQVGGGVVLEALLGQDPSPAPLSLSLVLEGDAYLDLSDYEHHSISLRTKKKIVIGHESTLPIPEPGTALLLGLGLAGLAAGRRA